MDWFLYDNGLRHEIVKFAITGDKYYDEERILYLAYCR